jgi:hypothetical protein
VITPVHGREPDVSAIREGRGYFISGFFLEANGSEDLSRFDLGPGRYVIFAIDPVVAETADLETSMDPIPGLMAEIRIHR